MSNSGRFDLAAIRQRLAKQKGPQFWRSLDELADTNEFREFLHREFPESASEWNDGVSRRNFLKLMGASLALAGLTACTRQPTEKIVPYVRQPEEIVPGKPLYFATSMVLGGFAAGILVESHMGRPTKVEGNPDHPASLGATDAFAQAAILNLYDPDRSQAILQLGDISSWSAFRDVLRARMDLEKNRKPMPGSGLRILTETITSPTLANQLKELLTTLPGARWHQYEPLTRDNVREGARLAFGQYANTVYRFDRADVVVSLDSDFLSCGPGTLRYVREFMARRRVHGGKTAMNRLYCFECTPSNTGAVSDHRWPMRSSEIATVATQFAGLSTAQNEVGAILRDLQNYRGSSIVIAGDGQPPIVHAMVHGLNQTLGNVGSTVLYTDPIEANPVNQMQSLRELVQEMKSGVVETLVILGGNPVYSAPADLDFAGALKKIGMRIHLSLYEDETSDLCHWHVPEAHFLEAWSDARAYDGTASIVQPLIAPLYGGRSAHELLSTMMGRPDKTGHDIVREFWQTQATENFEHFWRKSLHDGIIANTTFEPKTLTAQPVTSAPKTAGSGMEIVFQPDSTIYDGRFANNAWLQELPKQMTTLTWDNVAMVSPALAQRLALNNEDVVELQYRGRKVNAPVWIMPGHAPESVTVHLGYGRTKAGRVGSGYGFNAYLLQTSDAPMVGQGVTIRKTEQRWRLAQTQNHHSMEGRPVARSGTLKEYLDHPDFAREMEENPDRNMTMYPNYNYKDYAWGMAIDLNACVGCNACVVACVSENNIPVVGKNEVMRGREMPWIRVDRYYEGDLDNPRTYHQPVPCMHCENAPCEVVCPVNATVHSSEGLNDMVYNRCVGTRYCSNNCPYKVRRFNFFLYSDIKTPSLKLMRNPDVTVRTRGVMEKCTYCVQRINYAKIEAEKEGRSVKDGEIVTACQQSCPAEAIVFGNINDPNSKVAKLKKEPSNYGLLAELNTRPRTTYLANLRNPNEEVARASSPHRKEGEE